VAWKTSRRKVGAKDARACERDGGQDGLYQQFGCRSQQQTDRSDRLAFLDIASAVCCHQLAKSLPPGSALFGLLRGYVLVRRRLTFTSAPDSANREPGIRWSGRGLA
jgi:hypothetical protein